MPNTKKTTTRTKPENKLTDLKRRVEQATYDWVYDNFGRSEAEDPSWYIPGLALYVAESVLAKDYPAKHRICYTAEND